MRFRGIYEHTLDVKNRLTVPAKFRSSLGEGVVLSRENEGCLGLWTEAAFEQRVEAYANAFPEGSTNRRAAQLWWSARAHDTDVDAHGRVGLPPKLVAHAGLKKEVVLIGADDFLMIWSPERWEEHETKIAADFQEIQDAVDHPS